jgi:uncharacterized Rossmann fold enzyme
MISHWLLPPNFHLLLRILRGKEPRAHRTRFLRELVAWTTPPRLQSALLSAAYTLARNDVSDNVSLRDRHRGARCFVFGNGPSLRDVDLRPLKHEITIGANSFYKHPQAAEIDLKYLCIGDASFMEDTPKCVAWHRIIAEQHPNAVLMLNPDARPLMRKHKLYASHEVHFYRLGVSSNNPSVAHFDFLKPLVVGHNTGSRLAIPLAMYMGCPDIMLLGFDANWMENYRGSYHFYQTHELFPEFDSQAADTRWPRYADQLISALRDFEAHATLAECAKERGVRISNGSPNSLLDMYPRQDYAEHVRQRTPTTVSTS